jgi:hypothetical protein
MTAVLFGVVSPADVRRGFLTIREARKASHCVEASWRALSSAKSSNKGAVSIALQPSIMCVGPCNSC